MTKLKIAIMLAVCFVGGVAIGLPFKLYGWQVTTAITNTTSLQYAIYACMCIFVVFASYTFGYRFSIWFIERYSRPTYIYGPSFQTRINNWR